MRRDVFQAIADPTRREILNMLAHQQLNVNAVADNFDVSRAAIYKHMKILTECGMVVMTTRGRERYCEAKLDQLSKVADWVGQYRQFWTNRFDALGQYLDQLQASESATKTADGKKRKKQ